MIAEIRQRLVDQCTPAPLKFVSGVAEADQALDVPQRHRLPEAFVLPLGHRGSGNQVATGVTQRIAGRFGVLTAVSIRAERAGEQAAEDVEPIYNAERAALVGWQYDAALGQVLFESGRVMGFENGVLWWLDEFTVPELIQA